MKKCMEIDKMVIKFHKSNDNNFILGFEQYPWTKYQTKFQAIDLQGNMSAPISVTSMIKQADSNSLQLGWYPETDFETGIRKTVKWYLENQDWVNEVASGDYQKYYERMYGNR